MAIDRRKPEQQAMWINRHQLPKGNRHPFSFRLNDLLAKDGFDSRAEAFKANRRRTSGNEGKRLIRLSGADDNLGSPPGKKQ